MVFCKCVDLKRLKEDTRINYININETFLRRISFWGRFLGFVTGIFGSIVALYGLFTSLIGAIPGLITILFSRYLFNVGFQAKKVLESDRKDFHALDLLFNYFSKYLLLNGILVSIVLLFYIIFYLVIAGTGL